jgi:hypothetical protein
MQILVQPLKKIKNKIYVKASIYKAYIVEDKLIFTLYYFEPHLKTELITFQEIMVLVN